MKPQTKFVNVTARHIALGVKKNCSRCPVALALTDGLGATMVTAMFCRMHLSGGCGYPLILKTPKSVQRFMKAFDANKPVNPFKFKVMRPNTN